MAETGNRREDMRFSVKAYLEGRGAGQKTVRVRAVKRELVRVGSGYQMRVTKMRKRRRERILVRTIPLSGYYGLPSTTRWTSQKTCCPRIPN